MNYTEYILDDPVLVAILAGIVAVVVLGQKYLNWEQYYTLHRLKVEIAPVFAPAFPTISPKPYREGGEYIVTLSRPVREVWSELVEAGASPHLVASVKVRETPDGETQYSKAHVIFTHGDRDDDDHGEQTEAFLFDNGDGTTDVYGHMEGQTLEPEDHLTDAQTYGDPTGVVGDALGL